MKKRIILRVVVILFCWSFLKTANAQSQFRFSDSTAEWVVLVSVYYVDYGHTQHNTLFFAASGDTAIGGRFYQQISGQNQDNRFVRRDSTGKVWRLWRQDTLEHLVYDFGRISGDSFFTNLEDRDMEVITIHIDSVDSVNMNGWKKRQFVHCEQFCCNTYNDILVDGIGSINRYLFGPGLNFITTDDAAYSLLCYHEQGALIYMDPAYSSCVLGVEKLGEDQFGSVTPNPARDLVKVENIDELMIFNVEGQQILTQKFLSSSGNMDVSKLPKGLYFYSAKNFKSSKTATGKLLLQ